MSSKGEILSKLELLPRVLSNIILDYSKEIYWEAEAYKNWILKENTGGIIHYKQKLYLCGFCSHSVLAYNTKGEVLHKYSSLVFPCALDIDPNKSVLYIADSTHVTLLNLKLNLKSSWLFPVKPPDGSYSRGLKVDEEILYLTIYRVHKVFLCNSESGKLLNKWGVEEMSSKPGEFSFPYGLTIENNLIYVCDCENHRIQILLKENGNFIKQWGSGKESIVKGHFTYTMCIYYYPADYIFYIGDKYSVQLFSEDGICIQRLGDEKAGSNMHQFNYVHGICIVDEQLYTTDYLNHRVQIYRRSMD